MLAQASLKRTLFEPASRYYGIDIATREEGGMVVAYIRRRFLPRTDRFQLVQEHVVTEGERLDNIAARYFGDPTLFWRLCDANDAMRPAALTEVPGRRLSITLPLGVNGTAL
ncbi:LysM domain-containing protein [Mesorhizobium sp. B1-1-9]|nr:LysM domain-containing protein [Mesorhizobium sp. B1-1-9]